MEENEGEACQRNSDCASNVCRMVYRGGAPAGRRCMIGDGLMYTKNCYFPKDCQSGICKTIYDNSGKIVAKKCVKAQKLNRDSPYDSMMNKTSGYEQNGKFGVLSNHAIKQGLQEQGREGPVTESIVLIINIIIDLFSAIVYNFRVYSYDISNQGIMYSLFASLAFGIMHGFTQILPGGLISGPTSTIHNKDGRCDAETSRPIDMWYIRTIITLLFPPLGVLMAKGFSGFNHILISCLLTALFYFPGLIYSLSIISTSRYGLLEEAERKKGYEIKKKEEK